MVTTDATGGVVTGYSPGAPELAIGFYSVRVTQSFVSV